MKKFILPAALAAVLAFLPSFAHASWLSQAVHQARGDYYPGYGYGPAYYGSPVYSDYGPSYYYTPDATYYSPSYYSPPAYYYAPNAYAPAYNTYAPSYPYGYSAYPRYRYQAPAYYYPYVR